EIPLSVNVGKYGLSSAQHEGICRRDEGVRRDDHLVPRLDLQEESCHLHGVCGRGRQENWLADEIAEDLLALLSKPPATRAGVAALQQLANRLTLAAQEDRSVEGDLAGGSHVDPRIVSAAPRVRESSVARAPRAPITSQTRALRTR